MTTYICKCGRRVKKSTDTSTTGNRLSGYAPGHECWGCPYAMPYGDFQWDESARTVSRETRGYECRMSKTLTYASEFAGSIKDKCTCRVHSLDFDFFVSGLRMDQRYLSRQRDFWLVFQRYSCIGLWI